MSFNIRAGLVQIPDLGLDKVKCRNIKLDLVCLQPLCVVYQSIGYGHYCHCTALSSDAMDMQMLC